ncbi:MAG: chemotaxis protein CheD [Sulfuricella sp.]|nr:chemotaxis protein CheD [Sulfuricella sp.]
MKLLSNESCIEIYLLPGEIHFGQENTRIHTVLGSCVSISLWHPHTCSGGMCHFMLPSRGKHHGGSLDGRYADEAVELLLDEIRAGNFHPSAYQVKLFGGGNMFQSDRPEGSFDVARDNVLAARTLLGKAGFAIHAEDVGGKGHRRIIFDIASGNVWVRHEKISVVQAMARPTLR